MAREGKKVRSDKKREVKPSVDPQIYESVALLSYVLDRPIKDIGEQLVMRSFASKPLLEKVAKHFRRDLHVKNTVFIGHMDLPRYKAPIDGRRLSMRFLQRQYESLAALSYALDTPVATGTGLLLSLAVQDHETVLKVVNSYVAEDLTPKRRKLLRQYLEKLSDHEQRITWRMLLYYLASEALDKRRNLKTMIQDFLSGRDPRDVETTA